MKAHKLSTFRLSVSGNCAIEAKSCRSKLRQVSGRSELRQSVCDQADTVVDAPEVIDASRCELRHATSTLVAETRREFVGGPYRWPRRGRALPVDSCLSPVEAETVLSEPVVTNALGPHLGVEGQQFVMAALFGVGHNRHAGAAGGLDEIYP